MSNIDKQALRWKAEKATQGEWWSDSCGNEGAYGSGEDCVEGFTSYAVYDENNQILLDTFNSTSACIQEEYDGECHIAWDEVGQRNTEFIAAANPKTVLALLDDLEAAENITVEMPTFDGYVPDVARELQAAFRIACVDAGIKIAASSPKGE